MIYHHKINQHHRRKYIKRTFIFFVAVAIVSGLVVLALRLDGYLQGRVNTDKSTTTEQTSAYFAPKTKVFRTDYFQFQTNNNWAEIPSESSNGGYVYRGMNKSIIEEELIIYVNDIPGDLAATRLMPVELSSEGQGLSPGLVSDHCHKASENKNIDEKTLTFQKVIMNCDIDNTQFNVLVGETGGTTRLLLNRPDGTTARYSILYRNVQAVPDASELLPILQTFRTR